METVVETNDKNQSKALIQKDLKRAFISVSSDEKSDLNIGAKPFQPVLRDVSKQNKNNLKLKISSDSEIWKCISAQTTPHTSRESRSYTTRKLFVDLPMKMQPIPRPTFHRSLSLNISSDGLIHIIRSDNVKIQISLDQAIYVTCPDQNIQLSVSSSASATAVWHPIGRILQKDLHVDVVTLGLAKELRMAKFWYKGISFTSQSIPIVYLMDEAGLRTSNDRFVDVKRGHVLQTFTKGLAHSQFCLDEAVDVMHKAVHTKRVDATEIIEINRMRVISEPDGVLHIQIPNKKCSIRINPRKAGISLTTANIHCSASLGKSSHFFLRQGERRIHFDGSIFSIRNAGHSAGLDEQNKVSIFNKNSTK